MGYNKIIADRMRYMTAEQIMEIAASIPREILPTVYELIQDRLCGDQTSEIETELLNIYHSHHLAYAAITMAYNRLSKIGVKSENVEIAQNHTYMASVSLETTQMKMEMCLETFKIIDRSAPRGRRCGRRD